MLVSVKIPKIELITLDNVMLNTNKTIFLKDYVKTVFKVYWKGYLFLGRLSLKDFPPNSHKN